MSAETPRPKTEDEPFLDTMITSALAATVLVFGIRVAYELWTTRDIDLSLEEIIRTLCWMPLPALVIELVRTLTRKITNPQPSSSSHKD